METPHPKLVPLLEKHGLTWELFRRKGRPPKGLEMLREKRATLVTELHSSGMSWSDMMEITGLSNGAIQRLTRAMWNPASRIRLRKNMVLVGSAWKGKHRPGQLEAQWKAGVFDSPETRAKYSMTAIRLLHKYPKRAYPLGKAEVVSTRKGKTTEVRVRSTYEKRAVVLLDADPFVQTYEYEPLLTLPNGKGILPDFVVLYVDGSTRLIEVKPSYILKSPQRFARHIERLKLAEHEAISRGWSFAIWAEKELGI